MSEKFMQPTQKLELKTIQEMLDMYLALLTTNIEAWVELLAEDSVVEFPYAAGIASSSTTGNFNPTAVMTALWQHPKS
jgi:hypothetical protein